MHFIESVFHWFTTSANWTGPNGILQLFYNQAKLSVAVVIGALIIGGGLGVILGHTGRGGLVAVNAANAFRAVPTLALLTLLAIQPNISLKWGGFLASWIALLILAIPPILTNTYVGMRNVDGEVRERPRPWDCPAARFSAGSRRRWPCRSSWPVSAPPRSKWWPRQRLPHT